MSLKINYTYTFQYFFKYFHTSIRTLSNLCVISDYIIVIELKKFDIFKHQRITQKELKYFDKYCGSVDLITHRKYYTYKHLFNSYFIFILIR